MLLTLYFVSVEREWKRENKKWCWIVAAGCHLSIRLSYSSGDKGGSYWRMEKDGKGKP